MTKIITWIRANPIKAAEAFVQSAWMLAAIATVPYWPPVHR